MGKRLHFAVLLVLVVGAVFFLARRSSEPTYEGRSLTEWLEELPRSVTFSSRPPAVTVLSLNQISLNINSSRAARAIRAMGTNACPPLVRIIRKPDSAWKTSLILWSRNYSRLALRWQTPAERRSVAFAALSELGTAGAPALIELLGDEELPPDSQRRCLLLVERVGNAARPAVPALLRMMEKSNLMTRCHLLRPLVTAGSIDLPLVVTAATTNVDADARSDALATLSKLDEPVRTAANVLVAILSDSDAYARSQAALALAAGEKDIALRLILTLPHASPKTMAGTAYSLGHAAQRPELAVPLLMDCLADPNVSVRQAAAAALGRFGEHAAPALPRLKLLMNDTTRGVREAALNSVTEITAGEPAPYK